MYVLFERDMTPAQCRAARGLLNWTQERLAKPAGVSIVTVRNFENEKSGSQRASVAAIRSALEAAGVAFTNGGEPGVKLKARGGTIPADKLNASNDE
jgi:transcriptional regulator with XRE-family HTH domain